MTQKELESKIEAAQFSYYNGESIMTDSEFDTLWDTLKKIYPNSKLLKKIGSDLGESNGFKKEKHNIIMGSQNKANSAEEMDDFIKKGHSYIGQHKMDGSSVCLDYINGKFVRGMSRGDGEIGINLSENVKKMNGVPLQLKSNFTGTIRGEVLLKKSKLSLFPEAKNCRNQATGIFKRIDGKDCEQLDIVVYDAQYLDKSKSFKTQRNLLKWLESEHFNVAPYKFFDTLIGKKAVEYLKTEFAKNYEYDIDGIVFKQNTIDMNDITTNLNPKTQIALKPARTIVKSKIIDIDWKMNGGTLTPVAQLEPVFLLGSTVKQASLSNISQLEYMDIEIGDEVEITKCGEIIPKVIKNIKNGIIAKGYENSYN